MRENGRTGEEGKERAMKKGLRGLACLLALAVLLLALPTGASAETWTADISGSSGTITNGSAVLRVGQDDYIWWYLNITGVDASSGPLGDLVIPSSIGSYNMYTISSGAFQNNDTLTSITLSNTTIVSIQARAFKNCANLVRADLSECTMTAVNQELFKGCTSLETVILPSSIEVIYWEAFSGCTSLNTIYILSEDVIDLDNADAFAGCPGNKLSRTF